MASTVYETEISADAIRRKKLIIPTPFIHQGPEMRCMFSCSVQHALNT